MRARSPTSAPAATAQAQLARAAGGRGTLEEMFKGIREGTAKELPVLIKADVQGSVEAMAGALARLSHREGGDPRDLLAASAASARPT